MVCSSILLWKKIWPLSELPVNNFMQRMKTDKTSLGEIQLPQKCHIAMTSQLADLIDKINLNQVCKHEECTGMFGVYMLMKMLTIITDIG